MKLLPSSNLIAPRSLFVKQATTKGLPAPIPYDHNPGANTLTPDSSFTMQVVL